VDWLVIAAWGGLLFAAVMLATHGKPTPPPGPWAAQAIGFFSMWLPFVLYFSFLESSRLRASLGKRAVRVVAVGENGERLSFRQALVRNAVKLAPWEAGHAVAHQAIFAGDGPLPLWVWGAALIAYGGPLWWIVALFVSGRTPYDRLASARVERETP
jgi:uncharacterized RDD family membrane protein YckC